MKRMYSMSGIAAAVALACAAPLALAQTTPPTQPQHPQTGAMTHTPPYQTPRTQDQSRQAMPQAAQQSGTNMGQHDVTGTVKTIGANGIVDVRTTKGVLRVQFPDAVKHLKKGERITLHLSYSVGGSTSPTT